LIRSYSSPLFAWHVNTLIARVPFLLLGERIQTGRLVAWLS
jgi:hypothetical protein